MTQINCPNPICPTGTIISQTQEYLFDYKLDPLALYFYKCLPTINGLLTSTTLSFFVMASCYAVLTTHVPILFLTLALATLSLLLFATVAYTNYYEKSPKFKITSHKCANCAYNWPESDNVKPEAELAAINYYEVYLLTHTEPNLRNATVNTILAILLLKHTHNSAHAQISCEKALEIYKKQGKVADIAITTNLLGNCLLYQDRYEEARLIYQEMLAVNYQYKRWQGVGVVTMNLGYLATLEKNFEQAHAFLEEGLKIFYNMYDKTFLADGLNCMASLAVAQGQLIRATELYGAAATLRAIINKPLWVIGLTDYETDLAIIHDQLDEATFAQAWEQGRQMDIEQAVAFALTSSDRQIPYPLYNTTPSLLL